MRPLRLRWIPFKNVDWGRLAEHLIATLFAAIGGALATSSEPGEAIRSALRLWLSAALLYTAGFLQNGQKAGDVSAT